MAEKRTRKYREKVKCSIIISKKCLIPITK